MTNEITVLSSEISTSASNVATGLNNKANTEHLHTFEEVIDGQQILDNTINSLYPQYNESGQTGVYDTVYLFNEVSLEPGLYLLSITGYSLNNNGNIRISFPNSVVIKHPSSSTTQYTDWIGSGATYSFNSVGTVTHHLFLLKSNDNPFKNNTNSGNTFIQVNQWCTYEVTIKKLA